MPSQYLIRFDDICPTMNWIMWERVETLLITHNIRPILAVVPDNHDPELQVNRAAPDFWDRVRTWQARGWYIALHGFQHKFLGFDEGQYIQIAERSEFVGLPLSTQQTKLHAALECLHREKITPQLWAAPWHSFDEITLRVLRESGIHVVSDGMFLWPRQDSSGTIWIPQQLDDFRQFFFGIFTVCFHVNEWNDITLRSFEKKLLGYRAQITTLDEILHQYQHQRAWFSTFTLHQIGNHLMQIKQSLRLRSRLNAVKNFYRGLSFP